MYAASIRDVTTATAQRHRMIAVGIQIRPGGIDRAVDAILEHHLGGESLRHVRAFGTTIVMFGSSERQDAQIVISGLAATLEARPDVWLGAHLHDPSDHRDQEVRSASYDQSILETALVRFDPLDRLTPHAHPRAA
jgi:hypothetical protein